jgi:hypothetical protein
MTPWQKTEIERAIRKEFVFEAPVLINALNKLYQEHKQQAEQLRDCGKTQFGYCEIW